jgi:WD40 repeat protein
MKILEVFDLLTTAQQKDAAINVYRVPCTITACCFLPGGQHLVCGGRNGALLLIDHARGMQLHRVDVHRSCITSCRFSQQSRLLAVGDQRGFISTWDLEDGGFKMAQLCK